MSIRDLSTRRRPGSGAPASDPELESRAGESGDREREASASGAAAEPGRGGDRADRGSTLALRIGAAVASGLLGFLLIAQLQGTEDLGDRLASEREEDLAAILSDLSAEADRLQTEITELRLTLIEFESSAERDELALRSLRRRLDDLRILAGVVATEGEDPQIVQPPSQAPQRQLVALGGGLELDQGEPQLGDLRLQPIGLRGQVGQDRGEVLLALAGEPIAEVLGALQLRDQQEAQQTAGHRRADAQRQGGAAVSAVTPPSGLRCGAGRRRFRLPVTGLTRTRTELRVACRRAGTRAVARAQVADAHARKK